MLKGKIKIAVILKIAKCNLILKRRKMWVEIGTQSVVNISLYLDIGTHICLQ